MIPIEGWPILATDEMRAVEVRLFAGGVTADALMARAGQGVALAVHRFATAAEVLVLCGTGNNGGDGYVAAAALRRLGHAVRVAASGEARTDVATRARAQWQGPVEPLADAAPAPIVVDAILGIGATRPLVDAIDAPLARLRAAARMMIAVDLPSGMTTDTGELPPWLGDAAVDLTLALGVVKPAHVLQPGARGCGTVRLIDIGLAIAEPAVSVAARPHFPDPGPASHKYSRGMAAIVTGGMAGAARLAGEAALRAGAGYVALYGDEGQGGPAAIVHRPFDPAALHDRRIGAIVIGPGLGRDDAARARVAAVLSDHDHPLLVDGDALHLVTPAALRARGGRIVLTPHAGEFEALFGDGDGTAIDRARDAARRSGAIVVLKGPTTIVASPDRAELLPGGNPWLSTAGTGDVLAGAIAAQLASPHADPFAAAVAGVWLHARAARLCGKSFIADDLASALTAARAGA
ncbi:NAD(P)H-hydrate dehydratase [Sphingomonas sp. MA1305]|uniref:NAD(P)H-hydrate dehydratase n=1 Tax=Sphingomonas sp. MA1305 TaxID=2479204 RepID=UPI0018E03F85|nr:NAD(P)H-hydrate dehydratase [Sphingomonas sp. MA1305]